MKFFIVDMNVKVKNLDDTDSELVLGPAVGNHLSGLTTVEDALKVDHWARTLYMRKPLRIDESDKEQLLARIRETKLSVPFKAQAERIIKNAPEVKSSEDKAE